MAEEISRRRDNSAAITRELDDAVDRGVAPSKSVGALATLVFGSLQIKWPIYEAILYGHVKYAIVLNK